MFFSTVLPIEYKILDFMTTCSERLYNFVYVFLLSNFHGTSVLKWENLKQITEWVTLSEEPLANREKKIFKTLSIGWMREV